MDRGRRWLREHFPTNAVGWEVALALTTSILFPVAIRYVAGNKAPAYALVLISVGWFTLVTVVTIEFRVGRLLRLRLHQESVWANQERLDGLLTSMRKSLRQIALYEPSESGLFRRHFAHRVEDLEAELRKSALTRSLYVQRSHIERAGLVLNEFEGKTDVDVIRVIYRVSDGREFRDLLVQEWFQRVFDLTLAKKATVERLILFEQYPFDTSPDARLADLLVKFHVGNEGYGCRLMDIRHFRDLIDDYSLALEYDDFGLYADRYAFFGQPATKGGVRGGTWTNDPETLATLKDVFDKCWDHHLTIHPQKPPGLIALGPERVYAYAYELYESDHEHDVTVRSVQDRDRILVMGDSATTTLPLGWAMIGVSDYLARHALPGLLNSEGNQLRVIGVRDVERAKAKLPSSLAVELVAPYDEILSRDDVDVVYVTLPNALHTDCILAVLDAGKHVLCEKPLATSPDEVERILERATAQRLKVMEGWMYRFHPQWQIVRGAVASGRIGSVQTILYQYAYHEDSYDGPRFDPLLDGGAFNLVGSYGVDMARLLFGTAPLQVNAVARWIDGRNVDRTTSAILTFSSGHALITASVEAYDTQHVRIIGTEGQIEVTLPINPLRTDTPHILMNTGDQIRDVSVEAGDQFELEFAAFGACVRNGSSPPISLEESRMDSVIIEAVRRSAESDGASVNLP